MKTEHKAPEMSGIFKELAENFISFKRNLGFKYQSEEKVMSRFCRFSNDYDLTEVCITKKTRRGLDSSPSRGGRQKPCPQTDMCEAVW